MDGDFTKYLPHMDVNDGKARIMNNMKLYMTLLGKFKGREMTDTLLAAMSANDSAVVVQTAHALRGTASNLSFPVLQEITSEIEALGKAGQDSSHLSEKLDTTMAELDAAIADLTASV